MGKRLYHGKFKWYPVYDHKGKYFNETADGQNKIKVDIAQYYPSFIK